MGNKNELIDIEEITKELDNALAKVAAEVGMEIQMGFVRAINRFYNSYGPRSYDRTGALFQQSSASDGGILAGGSDFSKTWKRNGELSYEAGITVGPSNVSGNPYKKNPRHGLDVDPDFVYNISYMRGIHGFNRADLKFRRNVNPLNGRPIGELLRGGKYQGEALTRSEYIKQYNKAIEGTGQKKKTRWLPGYNYLRSDDKEYNRTFNAADHVPPNAPTIPHNDVQRDYKKTIKSIGVKLNKALGFA